MTDGTRKAADVAGLVAPFDEGGQGFLHGRVQEKTNEEFIHTTGEEEQQPPLVQALASQWLCGNRHSRRGFHSDADLAEGSR